MIIDYKKLNGFVEILRDCNHDDIELKFDKDGMSFRMMDQSQISLIDYNLPSSEFIKYGKEDWSFASDTEIMGKVMKALRGADEIEIKRKAIKKVDEEVSGKTDERYGAVFIHDTLKLDVESFVCSDHPPKIPTADGMVDIVMHPKEFYKALNKIESLGVNVIRINVDEDKLTLSAVSDSDALKGTISSKLDKKYEKHKVTISLDPLFKFVKRVALLNDSLDAKIALKLKTDSPISIVGELCGGRLEYWLAPRIDYSD